MTAPMTTKPAPFTNFFFYDPATGEGHFYATDGKGALNLIGKPQTGWRKTWSHFAPGNFGGTATTDILFYDSSRGECQFYHSDGKGSINPVGKLQTGWRTTWSAFVSGDFGGTATTDLLFYDASRGECQFYTTDGKGSINPLGKLHTGWRTTWSHMVPGNFGGTKTTDILFYDASTGECQVYTTDGKGSINPLGKLQTGWRRTWSHIVPGNFGVGATTGLFLYDASAGEAMLYSTDGTGGINPIGTLHTGWRTSWSQFIPGNVGGGSDLTGLLFYDKSAGGGGFFSTDGKGAMNNFGAPLSGMRGTWARIVPGNFVA